MVFLLSDKKKSFRAWCEALSYEVGNSLGHSNIAVLMEYLLFFLNTSEAVLLAKFEAYYEVPFNLLLALDDSFCKGNNDITRRALSL